MALQIGQKYVKTVVVTDEMSADRAGATGIMVLATPILVGLIERCCIEAIASELSEGQATVGTTVNIAHLAATPIGFTVSIESTLTAIEGRALTFEVTGHDGRDTICTCTHQRAVINMAKFVERLEIKTASMQA